LSNFLARFIFAVSLVFFMAVPASAQSARDHYRRAADAMVMADFTTAIAHAKRAKRKLGKTNPRLEGLLAQAYLGNEQAVEAKISIEKYKRLSPTGESARAFVREIEGKIDEALIKAEEEFEAIQIKRGKRRMAKATEQVSQTDNRREQKRKSNDSMSRFLKLARQSNETAALRDFISVFPQSDNVGQVRDQIKQINKKKTEEKKAAARYFAERMSNRSSYNSKLVVYELDDRYGLVDRSGHAVVPLKYYGICAYNKGAFFAALVTDKWGVHSAGKWVFLDNKGQLQDDLISSLVYYRTDYRDDKYAVCPVFKHDIMLVKVDGKWGAIDQNMNMVISPEYDNLYTDITKSFAKAYLGEKQGLVDFSGNVVVPAIYDFIEWPAAPRGRSNGRLNAKLDGEWFAIDSEGNRFRKEYTSVSSFENGVAIYEFESRFGLIDEQRVEVIPAQYRKIYRMRDDRLRVQSAGFGGQKRFRGKYGIVDHKNNIIVPLIYDEIKHLYDYYGNDPSGYENHYLVKSNGKWGLLDGDNKKLLQAKYYSIKTQGTFVKLISSKPKKRGWYFLKTGVLIPAVYYEFKSSSKLFFVRKYDRLAGTYKWGWYDKKTGGLLQRPIYDYHHTNDDHYTSGSFSVSNQGNKPSAILYSSSGKPLTSEKYDYIVGSSLNQWEVKLGNRYGLIDSSGNEILAIKYSLSNMSENDKTWDRSRNKYIFNSHISRYFDYEGTKKYGLIDRETMTVYPAIYDFVDNTFDHGKARVRIGKKWGFIDKNNSMVWDIIYDDLDVIYANKDSAKKHSFEDVVPVRLGNKWGILSLTRQIVIPIIYDGLGNSYHYRHYFPAGIIPVRKGKKWGVVDKNHETVIPFKYHQIKWGDDGFLIVKKGKMFGVVDMLGKRITKIKYQYISEFYKGIAIVKHREKYGFINAKGKVIGAIKFDALSKWGDFGKGYAIGRINGTRYRVESDGSLNSTNERRQLFKLHTDRLKKSDY